MYRIVVSLVLAVPTAALACPGGGEMAASDDTRPTLASADPTHAATKAEWISSCCKFSTGMMAQRVHADGAETTITGKLAPASEKLDSQVAAPFVVGGLHVIANAVLETVDTTARLSLTGKTLEVDGVKYLLVTSATKSNT